MSPKKEKSDSLPLEGLRPLLQQSKLFSCIDANCTQFKTLDNKNKLIWLMNSENKDVI
jgi:hypothetical protein